MELKELDSFSYDCYNEFIVSSMKLKGICTTGPIVIDGQRLSTIEGKPVYVTELPEVISLRRIKDSFKIQDNVFLICEPSRAVIYSKILGPVFSGYLDKEGSPIPDVPKYDCYGWDKDEGERWDKVHRLGKSS